VNGLDPDLGLVEVSGDLQSVPSSAWSDAVAAGQLALAHELVGASRTMLQLAREHAVERVQFGRPIAAFQAVRHRLAESLVAVEAADAALHAAWEFGSPGAAAMAKAVAGRSARTVARHCQQVLAGIGFTTEHPFHRYLRRVLVLDGLLGDTRTLTKRLGDELLSTRQLPPVLPL
jgi:alkylation response protein AidB-like acyl-CoA dehydrogenase